MKIAVFSDIHGNIVALDAVLKDAKENNVDKYIVAGDMILDFPFPNEVVNKIKVLTPYVIKGNREKYLENYEADKNNSKWDTMQGVTIKDNCEQLSNENKEYIKKLPEQLSINLEGLKIKVVHGSPYSISAEVDLNDKMQLDKITSEMEEDILIVGHTHIPAQYVKHNGKIIINDGTVGMNSNNKNAQYVVLDYENKDLQIQVKDVEYDKGELGRLIMQSPIYEKSYAWINLGYCDIVETKNIRMQFTNEAIERMNVKHNIQEQDKSKKTRYSKFNVIDDDIFIDLVKEYEKYFLLKRREK